jgi:hypothetical protein
VGVGVKKLVALKHGRLLRLWPAIHCTSHLNLGRCDHKRFFSGTYLTKDGKYLAEWHEFGRMV